MAYYLVRATPKNLDELRARLDSGEIKQMRPFGGELDSCMREARLSADGRVIWEEQCFCSPPLKQERSVLDVYFTDLTTETVNSGAGWSQIEHLPYLWEAENQN